MSNHTCSIDTGRRAALAVAVVATLLGSAATLAQQQQQPQYPQGYVGQPQQPNTLRQVFANTLTSVMQGVSTAATAGIVQGVNGSLVNWFDRQQQGATYSSYPSTAAAYPPSPAYPTSPPPTPSTYPTPAGQGYPPQYYDPNAAQVYDAQTGQLAGNSANAYLEASSASSYGNTLYAGVAYEVHAVGTNGMTTAVNPASYLFRTGDQFVVYYRPSMPGRMEVYNVNPLGQQTRIDAVEMAAGQMAKLGPYQFSGTAGQESLRLVLMPCSTAQLMTATRDIVNVSGSMPGQPSAGGFALSSCTATRSVNKIKTRDIAKVAVDGMTSFALDPVSPQEYSSGQLDGRDVTIVFRHQ